VFVVDFATMKQRNASGSCRDVRRVSTAGGGDAVAAHRSMAPRARSRAITTSSLSTRVTGIPLLRSAHGSLPPTNEPPPTATSNSLPPLTAVVVAAAHAAVAAIDGLCDDLAATEADPALRVDHRANIRLPVSETQIQAVLLVYSHAIADLDTVELRAHYGYTAAEIGQLLTHHREGDPMPTYFANASSHQSIFYRKLVSLLGMRNLLRAGIRVFADMRATLFSGDPTAYGQNEGPHLMRRLTGNAVDLDTVVLRPSHRDSFAAINDMIVRDSATTADDGAPLDFQQRRGFSTPQEFARSPIGSAMAYNAARPLIDAFVQRFGLEGPADAALRSQRRLDLPPHAASAGGAVSAVPISTSHTDRGKHAVWLYDNAGTVSFHANVPTMDDVYGGLLRAPWYFVTAYLIAKVKRGGSAAVMLDFFETALADTCFNQKWRAVEAYVRTHTQPDAIYVVLSKLQAAHAHVFTQARLGADDERGTWEVAEMAALLAACAPPLEGLDPVSGILRRVTPADIPRWRAAVLGS
jgi:hypothetical protein